MQANRGRALQSCMLRAAYLLQLEEVLCARNAAVIAKRAAALCVANEHTELQLVAVQASCELLHWYIVFDRKRN
jgi:hypothetical protein